MTVKPIRVSDVRFICRESSQIVNFHHENSKLFQASGPLAEAGNSMCWGRFSRRLLQAQLPDAGNQGAGIDAKQLGGAGWAVNSPA